MKYFEDLAPGMVIELGNKHITEEEIIRFATEFDPQPFHLNHEAGKASLFGGLAASGWHTAAIFMRLMVDNFLSKHDSLGSPGVDELRWLKPVLPNDTLSGKYLILECNTSKSRSNLGIVKFRGEMTNQNNEIVMTLLGVGFLGRQPETSSS